MAAAVVARKLRRKQISALSGTLNYMYSPNFEIYKKDLQKKFLKHNHENKYT